MIPGLGRFPWRGAWEPTPVFLPGESPWTEEPGRLHIVHRVAKSQTLTLNFEAILFKMTKSDPHSSFLRNFNPTHRVWSKLGSTSFLHTLGNVWGPGTLRTPSIDSASDYW